MWHAVVGIILKTVEEYSKVGLTIDCGDAIRRLLYFFIHILSADYEEQYGNYLNALYFVFLKAHDD